MDPGIGFGKTVEHNIEILRRLDEFKALGFPVCIGTSRKSFLGNILDKPDAGDRLAGTIATCVLAVMKGAGIIRVHDVKEVKQAIKVTETIWRN
jgi:dihydropteroate synthase